MSSTGRGRRRDLVLVTAGLELEGGGRALVGRLLAASGQRWAAERAVGFEVLSLGRAGLPAAPLEVRNFNGRRTALAAQAWRRQLAPDAPALLFDLLGLARLQVPIPPLLRSPYGLMLYGIEVWRPLSLTVRWALSGATLPISISHHTLERAEAFLPPLAAPPVVLPLTLEARPPEGEVDEALLARIGRGFPLIVGRMAASERYKGHDELLAALTLLPSGPPLVVVGEGDDRPRLEHEARRLGLAERVVFTGFVSEATLAALYRACGVLAMVSQGEGFGLVYLEAMRHGKPVIAARDSAAEEVVADGSTGLLVPAGDARPLAAALRRLATEPGLAEKLGEAGRRRHDEHFGGEAFYHRLAALLDRLTQTA